MGFFKKLFRRTKSLNNNGDASDAKDAFTKAKHENEYFTMLMREIAPLSTVFKSASIIREIKNNSVNGKIIISGISQFPEGFDGYLPVVEGNYIISLYKIEHIERSTEFRRNREGVEKTVNKLVLTYSDYIPFIIFGNKEIRAVQNIIEWAKLNENITLEVPPMERLDREKIYELLGSAQIICMNNKAPKRFSISKLLKRVNDIKRASQNIWLLSAENVSIRITYMLINLGERRLARKNEPFTLPELYDIDPRFMSMNRENLESMVERSVVMVNKQGDILVLIPFSKNLL